MKVVCMWLVSFVCLAVSVKCYGGEGSNPLAELLKAKRKKTSANNQVTEDVIMSTYYPMYVGKHEGLKELDKISMLPGQPANVNFDQYSGYVTVDPDAGRALFYYFTESQNASTKPLVLWLNGGPGCSSLGKGAMTELGPFRVNPDGKTLTRNENAWNKVANVIYLESPAGVGFSYSNRSSDYIIGDEQTALDTYAFLVNWMEKFPEYKGRDFYITGESYAGHFVPQLATKILQYNQSAISLKGIALGNAYIDDEDQDRGPYEFLWKHTLISDEIYQGIVINCNISLIEASPSPACEDYQDRAAKAAGRIFPFDIYAPFCSSNSTPSSKFAFDPCSDKYVLKYLNTPQVQKALHANVTRIPRPWALCSSIIIGWQDSPLTMLPVIQHLIVRGIDIWFYSGDTDSVVSITTTMYSFNKLKLSVRTPWYPWYVNGEVGGYAIQYQNITLVTVRGAGHHVPSYQPERALALFSSFISGKLPPNGSEAKII